MLLKKILVYVVGSMVFFIKGTIGLHLATNASLKCYGESLDQFDEASLADAETLLKSVYYNSSLPNFIYTFGFNGKEYGNFTVKVLNALLQLADRNVFLVNWQKAASSLTNAGNYGFIISYIFSGLPQSEKIGFQLGLALERMSNKGFKLNETHAMGHSLGAHMLGDAGRYLAKVGKNISRITGCDPAGALFDQYAHLAPPLDKDCADFVDTVHTDPGGYAMNSSVSDLDIWVNFRNFIYGPKENQVQPGCPVGDYDMFTQNDLCSHNRCLELWIQTWTGTTLEASQAQDYETWNKNAQQGVPADIVVLGDNTDKKAFGNYYMNTTGLPPYQNS